MRHLALLVVLCTPLATVEGQARANAARATIVGDVYLVMENGDTKRGAGREILLLPPDVETKRDSVCRLPFPVRTRVSDSLTKIARRSSDSAAFYLWQRKDSDRARRFYQDASRHEELASSARISAETSAEQRRENALRRLLQSAVARAHTGMNARYSFENIPPGRYVIYGEWRISGVTYAWLAPVEVSGAGNVHRDLDNSVASNTALLSCRSRT